MCDNKTPRLTLQSVLYQILNERQLSQAEFAKSLDISKGTVSKMLSNPNYCPGVNLIIAILAIYPMDVIDLLDAIRPGAKYCISIGGHYRSIAEINIELDRQGYLPLNVCKD